MEVEEVEEVEVELETAVMNGSIVYLLPCHLCLPETSPKLQKKDETIMKISARCSRLQKEISDC